MAAVSPNLTVISPSSEHETVSQRIQRLQAEARDLARGHVDDLIGAILVSAAIGAEIANGGDAYPAGVRDLARRYVEDAEGRIQNLESLSGRS